MSAPDTNIEKQQERHKPSLLGIGIAVAFGLIMALGLVIYVFSNADDPTAEDVTVGDGDVGEQTE